MNINDLTIGEAREIVELLRPSLHVGNVFVPVELARFDHTEPWEIGKNYLIRTVTMIDTGRLVAVTEHELVLEDAAWIADTGRFTQAAENVTFNEVELFPSGRVIVGRGSVIDAVQIAALPRAQK